MANVLRTPRISYVTDIEGNWHYVQHYLNRTKNIWLNEHDELELNEGVTFVFGGDAGDKGNDTLRCYEKLVCLKKRYPSRVILLAGNRDVNKMRFTSELDDSELNLNTMTREIHDGPLWIPKEKRVTIRQYLEKRLEILEKDNITSAKNNETSSDKLLDSINTKVERLKYMLQHTMGSDGDFERRRTELIQRGLNSNPSDEDVLQSFISSVKEGGVIREYLSLASLAFLTKSTLFVHGGIMNGQGISSLGRVPDQKGKLYRSIEEWTEKLNQWYQREVEAWINQPKWNTERSDRGGNELLKYVLPDYDMSVIMGRHLYPSGMPKQLSDEMAMILSENAIQKLILGHTPHGTCPTVIKQHQVHTSVAQICPVLSSSSTSTTFQEVIMCDTSYSDMSASDNRGIAASELVVDQTNGEVSINGILPDGNEIAFKTTDEFIGHELLDGTIVKARLKGKKQDTYLVFSVQNGFQYTYHYRTRDEILSIGLVAR